MLSFSEKVEISNRDVVIQYSRKPLFFQGNLLGFLQKIHDFPKIFAKFG